MTKKLEMYRCKICGNLVQVILDGAGELVCCGEPMELLKPNTTDNVKTEYHVPVYKYTDKNGIVIQVGKEPHPMTAEHSIKFIETISEDRKRLQLQYLEAGDEPKMLMDRKTDKQSTLAYCNLHGLWEGACD